MALHGVLGTGISGMRAAKSAIATSGHNVSNANTEGFSRQRVEVAATSNPPMKYGSNAAGTGVAVTRVGRINDQYIEKQLRNGSKDLAHFEEKEVHLTQLEDVFNEMNGEGLNRIVSKFFNDFRKLGNDPNSEAVRQSLRESSQAVITDFKRIRKDVLEISRHIDSRIEGYSRDLNAAAKELVDLNKKIVQIEIDSKTSANDLKDQRDQVLKKIASLINVSTHSDNAGNVLVDIPNIGPLVSVGRAESFKVERTPANSEKKIEGAYDISLSSSVNNVVTHILKGGKMGALLDARDETVQTVLDRIDNLAFNLSTAVNQIHSQGFTRNGASGVSFFNPILQKERAAEFLDLSEPIKNNINNIAAAAQPDAPGDNRIALAISGLQNSRLMNEGQSSFDDFYNGIVSDVGIVAAKNKADLSQQKGIVTQLKNMRDQISGVSLDEETANILQYQHAFDASAKVIQVANEMLDTVLNLKKG